MKQKPSTADPSLLPDPPSSDFADDADSVSIRARFLTWLKHFALYLGTVAMTCAIGLYFLQHIPIPQDAAQLFKNVGDPTMPRTLAAVLSPSTPSARIPGISPRPTANSTNAVSGQASGPANASIPSVSPSSETTDDPNVAPPLPEQPVATSVDPTDPTAEALVPVTPEMEIEKLLADAQQQIDSRRFTAPASGNALGTYRRILEIQPDQPAALEGIQRIAAYYRDAAQQSLQQGRVDESLGYINRGLRAAPKNDALLSLRQEAQARRAKQRQQEAQRAMQEAAQRERAEQAQPDQQRNVEEHQPWWRQPSQSQDSGFNQR